MCQRANLKGILKIHKTEWKWKHSRSEFWDATKAVLRELNTYIREEEIFQINNLSSYFKELERWDKNKPRAEGWIADIKVIEVSGFNIREN